MYRGTIFGVLIVLIVVTFVQAQDEHPLVRMLENVPIYSGVTGDYYNPLYFVDVEAAERSRPGTIAISDIEEAFKYLDSENQEDKDKWYLWSGTVPPIVWGYFRSNFGYDVFKVDRYLVFGDRGAILEGEFDENGITDGLTPFNVQQSQFREYTIWCYMNDCSRNGEQSVDGNLLWPNRRAQPILSVEPYLVSHPDFSLLEYVIDANIGEKSSLAQGNIFRAAVDGITINGNLIQASFFYPNISNISPSFDAPYLPPYQLFALAQIVDGSNEFTIIAMVYQAEEEAYQAIEAVEQRITTYRSEFLNIDLIDMLEQKGLIEFIKFVHYSQSTDMWVGIVVMRGNLPSSEPNSNCLQSACASGDGRFRAMGLIYRELFTSAIRGDINWMAPNRGDFVPIAETLSPPTATYWAEMAASAEARGREAAQRVIENATEAALTGVPYTPPPTPFRSSCNKVEDCFNQTNEQDVVVQTYTPPPTSFACTRKEGEPFGSCSGD